MCMLCKILEEDVSDMIKLVNLLQLNLAIDNEVLGKHKLLESPEGMMKLKQLSGLKAQVVELCNLLKTSLELSKLIPDMPRFNAGKLH